MHFKNKVMINNLCKPNLLFQIVILLPVCPMQQYSTMLPHTSKPPLTAVLSDTTTQEGTLSSPATQLAAGTGTTWNALSTVSTESGITIMYCYYMTCS